MTNLRILFALNYYHPYISGLSEYVRIIAEALVERGCSVTVLAGRHEANLPPNEVRNGVQIVRAKVLLKLHKGYLSSNLIRTFRRLAREADVVHLSAPMLEAGLLARLTPAGTPLVLTHHCDVIAQRRGSLLEALAVAAVKASARATFQRADRVLVNSKDYASSSVEVRGILQKCLEVPPPDSAPESPLPPRAPGNRVGFLGRWVAEKGIGVLLAAIPAVLRHIPDARFILAGNYASVAGGSEYNRLKPELDRLRDSVETPGSLPDEKLFDFYRSLDAFVLPSVDSYESFGIVQLEAMKSGAPVIATDMPGVRVPVQRTGNGMLVPPGDADALARAIIAVLTVQRFDRQKVAEIAWEKFPKSRPVDETLALYHQLVKAGAA